MHSSRRGNSTLDFKVLGVCSGIGLNELNFALVHYHQDTPSAPLQMELLKVCEIAIPSVRRNPILDLLRMVSRKPQVILQLNALLGHMFSKGIKFFWRRHNVKPTTIDLIGTHASNLQRLHLPATGDTDSHALGWNAAITAETGITAVSDFLILESGVIRPLIPPIAFVNRLFLQHPTKFRVCLDIEELANITCIPPMVDFASQPTISHDCGPGSLLIDYAVRYCTSNDHRDDYSGKFGSEGKVNEDIVNRFMKASDYLRRAPPLSIAQEMFGDHEAQRLINECIYLNMSDADTIATITRITAQNIVKQYLKLLQLYFPPGQKVDELFICGPTATNMIIVDYLEANLPESVITKPLEDLGIPGGANQGVCCAHLALEAVLGQATQAAASPSSPTSTPIPSKDDAIKGNIVRGDKWQDLQAHIQDFSEGKPLHVTKNINIVRKRQTVINSCECLTTAEMNGNR